MPKYGQKYAKYGHQLYQKLKKNNNKKNHVNNFDLVLS